MLHKKATLSAALILGIVLTSLQAQSLYVKDKGGTQTSLALNGIRKLSFSEGNLMITKTDGNSGIYAISNIRYLSFTDYILNVSEQKLQQNNSTLIYPNPASDLLQVKYESEKAGNFQIKIIDLQGKLIKQVTLNSQYGTNYAILDVSGLTQGLYIFQLQNGNKIETLRFIKE